MDGGQSGVVGSTPRWRVTGLSRPPLTPAAHADADLGWAVAVVRGGRRPARLTGAPGALDQAATRWGSGWNCSSSVEPVSAVVEDWPFWMVWATASK